MPDKTDDTCNNNKFDENLLKYTSIAAIIVEIIRYEYDNLKLSKNKITKSEPNQNNDLKSKENIFDQILTDIAKFYLFKSTIDSISKEIEKYKKEIENAYATAKEYVILIDKFEIKDTEVQSVNFPKNGLDCKIQKKDEENSTKIDYLSIRFKIKNNGTDLSPSETNSAIAHDYIATGKNFQKNLLLNKQRLGLNEKSKVEYKGCEIRFIRNLGSPGKKQPAVAYIILDITENSTKKMII